MYVIKLIVLEKYIYLFFSVLVCGFGILDYSLGGYEFEFWCRRMVGGFLLS